MPSFLTDKTVHYYDEPLDISDYYQFCLDEAFILQKTYLLTSIDLPVYDCYLDDVKDLEKALLLHSSQLLYKKLDVRIGNNKINAGMIILKDQPLIDLFDDFLIAPLIKVRYELLSSGKYLIKFTAFALTSSIHYTQLTELYSALFSELESGYECGLEENPEIDFIRKYRSIVYIISIYIGMKLQKILSKEKIDIKYIGNAKVQFNEPFSEYINHRLCENERFLFTKINQFKYRKPELQQQWDLSQTLSIEKMEEIIFDKITQNETAQKKFTKLEDLDYLYRTEGNRNNFCFALNKGIESFSMTNELKFNPETHWIQRGVSFGECSASFLPFTSDVFFTGLNKLYNKVNKQYEIYLNNYDLFIKKFKDLLYVEEFFDMQLITIEQFNYLSKYFKNINSKNFKDVIESKMYLLENKTNEQFYIEKRVEFMLKSSDFCF